MNEDSYQSAVEWEGGGWSSLQVGQGLEQPHDEEGGHPAHQRGAKVASPLVVPEGGDHGPPASDEAHDSEHLSAGAVETVCQQEHEQRGVRRRVRERHPPWALPGVVLHDGLDHEDPGDDGDEDGGSFENEHAFFLQTRGF